MVNIFLTYTVSLIIYIVWESPFANLEKWTLKNAAGMLNSIINPDKGESISEDNQSSNITKL